MDTFSTTLFISSDKPLEISLPNTKIKSIKGKLALQSVFELPQYLYSYSDKKINVYQISPFKLLNSFRLKNELQDYIFSQCGNFLFILYNNKLEIYYENKLIDEISGNYFNFILKRCYDKICFIGDFNIITYKTDNKEKSKNSIYDFSNNTLEKLPIFYQKYSGFDIFINRNIMLIANNNEVTIYIKEIEKLKIYFPQKIKKVLADSLMSKIFALCDDNKIYISELEGNVYDKNNIIDVNKNIDKVLMSFCECFLYIFCDDEIFIYSSIYNNLIDRFEIKQKIDDVEVVLSGDIDIKSNYFHVK